MVYLWYRPNVRLRRTLFPRLISWTWGACCSTMLSGPYVDVALVGMRELRYVEINNAISNDVSSRLDLAQLHDRYVR